MPLSWNEIKAKALEFSKKWATETSEDAEAKSFMDDFFDVFGVSRRRVATFEQKVKKADDKDGYIDLLWKGTILIEMKSKGKKLINAYQQAIDYFPGLKDHELPKYVLVSDFATFVLTDLDTKQETSFPIADFYKHIKLFGFIAGYQTKTYPPEDPVNIKAADLMSNLHDGLVEIGYKEHPLRVYLVRILFCLFAEDTGIFEKQQFQEFIEQKTNVDGSDLAQHLALLFETLNKPVNERLKKLDEHYNNFRYINGKLFEEQLPFAAFDSKLRALLLKCCSLDWSRISPAIFGSMFQNVMDANKRHSLGAHYTSETNILKLIKPLFLDNLWAEFEKIKTDKPKLAQFHKKLASLKFLDPACGCGNFLVITYRELRLLEIEVIKAIQKGQMSTNINNLVNVDVSQFYGIEYEEFPARIAEVALWLTDHQMNTKISVDFGQYFARLPLKKGSNIIQGNALRTDWNALVPKEELSYIIGNPPFLGHHLQSEEQKNDLRNTLYPIQQAGVMDYVSAWYMKASRYINDTSIKVGYVSTNSITQGEQVGILWDELINKEKVIIHFAHRTFKWNNEAKGKAAVYCVIIGFSKVDSSTKLLYDYVDIKGEPNEYVVKNINPYLIDAPNLIIRNRNKPICNVPVMMYGNKPTDGGNYLLTENEFFESIEKDPNAQKFIKPFLGAVEFLNGKNKYCIWLVDAKPQEIKESPFIINRVNLVKKFRAESKAESTRNYPHHTLFKQVTQPKSDFILIPCTTSENRKYIPIGFFGKEYIVGNTCLSIPNATNFHFGVLTSAMHMAWVNYTCGRLESRYRYSKDIVYNNYPWPENPTQKQKEAVEKAAQQVLDVRAKHQATGSSLADLYDPLTMPPDLVKAHQQLDKAVDLCYRAAPFPSESKRMEFLFELYEKYTAGLFATVKAKKKRI